MANYRYQKITGKWRKGFALDLHSTSSTHVGQNPTTGRDLFDTSRSEIGELLYRLKYQADISVIKEIVDAVEHFMGTGSKSKLDIIIPVPPSSIRTIQPVMLLTEEISKRVGIPYINCITKMRKTKSLKETPDVERAQTLHNIFTIDKCHVQGKRVLLFDDVYDSGSTLNEITSMLYEQGQASDVCVLTITKTRRNR